MAVLLPLPTDEDIEAFEKLILRQAYYFQDRDLIREALQLRGLLNPNGNRVLAQVGDSIIRHVLLDQGRDRNKTPGRTCLLPLKTIANIFICQQERSRRS